MEHSLTEWLKLGVVRHTKSPYHSPIFCVPKKSCQGLRIVQDFRGLDAKAHTDIFSMNEANKCITDIGRENSAIFTTIDLTTGFWQMSIDESDSHLTALMVQGLGQFKWITSPMGMLGCPASFQSLMEKVLDTIKNIIVYIDNIIIHTASHEHHLEVLEDVLQRLEHHNLKINLTKCFFGNSEVANLGFVLVPEGIRPGKKNWPFYATCLLQPANVKFGLSLGCATSFKTISRTLPSSPNPSTDSTDRACTKWTS